MEKSGVGCRESCLWTVFGVTALMVHAGCVDGRGLSPYGSAGRVDLDAGAGAATPMEGDAGTQTLIIPAVVNSAEAGPGGVVMGGSGDAPGAGGFGGVGGSKIGGPGGSGEPSATGGTGSLGGIVAGGMAIGRVATGGVAASGSATGGVATGELAASGIATGGIASTGGITTGGVATGGGPSGGVATGGVASGGIATGGIITGGIASTGGITSGGVIAGGVASGGVASGGIATGGSSCVFGAFGAPEKITGLGLSFNLYSPSLSADGLTLYLSASKTGQPDHIYVATRADRGAQFAAATAVTSVNSSSADGTPFLSYDGLTLYFYSDRPGGVGGHDLWFAQRSDPLAGFGSAQLLAGINSTDIDYEEWVSRDELTLLIVSTRKGGMGKSDIWRATRVRRTDDFSPPTTLVGVNSSARDDRPAVSSDGLTIIFSSDRAGTAGDLDLWLATRSNAQADFSNPTNLSALNSTASDGEPNFSADDRELFFISSRGGSFEIYRAVRACQ